MDRLLLMDDEWDCVADLFGEAAPCGRPRVSRRQMIYSILWIVRVGSPWWEVPKELGSWHTTWRQVDRCNGGGLLGTALQRLQSSYAEAGRASTMVKRDSCRHIGGRIR